MARLCVDIEPVALLREMAGVKSADPVTLSVFAEVGGADGMVCSLNEKFSPITERDVRTLKEVVKTHLNVKIPPVKSMVAFVLNIGPDMVTLVPFKKSGSAGLDVLEAENELSAAVEEIRSGGVVISLFVEPILNQVKAAAKIGADYVELDASGYACAEDLNERADNLSNIASVALAASKLGLGVSASQGIDYHNAAEIAAIREIEEINIGEAIVARALSIGMEEAVRDMAALVH
jgi:pyridoxine 5-phosphate synthase